MIKPSACAWEKWKSLSPRASLRKRTWWARIGDLLSGIVKGRENDTETTIFDATGLYILDLVAAKVAITKAKDAKMGIEVDM